MHSDLNLWLEKVWAERATVFSGFRQTGRAIHQMPLESHSGINRVYGMYTAGASDSGGASDSSAADMPTFLKNIAQLVEELSAKCIIQYGGKFVEASVGELRSLASGDSLFVDEAKPADELEVSRISPDSIRYGFIHVLHGTNSAKATSQRIYLNLAVKSRGLNFAEIVRAVYGHPGFRSSKVAGQEGGPRNDSALLYLADEAAVKFALGAIASIQEANPGAFQAGLPRLTNPAPDLTGVGRGMEPPSYAVIRQGGKYYKMTSPMSFGLWRAALIFMALDRTYWTRPGQSEDRRRMGFKRRAAKYFRAAGIDPDNPSVQIRPDSPLPEYPG